MRDVVILHAPADADTAAALARLSRGALTSVLAAEAPRGAFGPQFHVIALWSKAAADAGLASAMADMLEGRAERAIVSRVDATPVDARLVRVAGLVAAADRDALEAALSVRPVGAPAATRATLDMRAAVAAAAAGLASLAFGAILAHASGQSQAAFKAAEFGMIEPAAPVEATPAVVADDASERASERVSARTQALLARAHAESHSAEAVERARVAEAFRRAPD